MAEDLATLETNLRKETKGGTERRGRGEGQRGQRVGQRGGVEGRGRGWGRGEKHRGVG